MSSCLRARLSRISLRSFMVVPPQIPRSSSSEVSAASKHSIRTGHCEHSSIASLACADCPAPGNQMSGSVWEQIPYCRHDSLLLVMMMSLTNLRIGRIMVGFLVWVWFGLRECNVRVGAVREQEARPVRVGDGNISGVRPLGDGPPALSGFFPVGFHVPVTSGGAASA